MSWGIREVRQWTRGCRCFLHLLWYFFSCSIFHKSYSLLLYNRWSWRLKEVAMNVSIQSVSSVTQSCLTLQPHELQHARPPCSSQTPRVYSNLCPLSQWCHPAISSSVVLFSSCPQSLTAPGSFPMSQLFASGGQSIGVSASTSVLPTNT